MKLQLDDWQQKVIETKGNMVLRSGRQVGKSTVVSIKTGEYACNNNNKTVLIIARTERQAYLLFEKIMSYVYDNYKKMIKKGKDRPTKSRIRLINGSVIHCVPCGLSGAGIRGYTIDLLIADEAAFIPEEVFSAVTPMLAITKGNLWLLSTPFGRGGYFYECFNDPKFTHFHISAEDCPRKDQDFLDHEKNRMTKLQYAQEYLGEFVDELRQFFSDELIKKCCIGKRKQTTDDTYLGVDIARMGEDDSTFEIISKRKDRLIHIESIVTSKTYTTETTETIIALNSKFKFNRIYVDDMGVGAGVLDQLLVSSIGNKVEGISNSRKPIDRDEKRFRRIMKNDLYDNLLKLMESGKIILLDDDEVIMSLKSIQFEYTDNEQGQRRLKLWGSSDHIVEGLTRGAWCIKDKHLKLWVASKSHGI